MLNTPTTPPALVVDTSPPVANPTEPHTIGGATGNANNGTPNGNVNMNNMHNPNMNGMNNNMNNMNMSPNMNNMNMNNMSPNMNNNNSSMGNNNNHLSNLPPNHPLVLLSSQLTYYFSTSNLTKDLYLKSLLIPTTPFPPPPTTPQFATLAAPCTALATFSKVRALALLTSPYPPPTHQYIQHTLALLRTAAEQSPLLNYYPHVDGIGPATTLCTMATPLPSPTPSPTSSPASNNNNGQPGGTTPTNAANTPTAADANPYSYTLILRELPAQFTANDVKGIFAWDGFRGTVQDCVGPEFGGCWYVTVLGEEGYDKLDMMLEVGKQVVAGKSVKARLKVGGGGVPVKQVSPVNGMAGMNRGVNGMAGGMGGRGGYNQVGFGGRGGPQMKNKNHYFQRWKDQGGGYQGGQGMGGGGGMGGQIQQQQQQVSEARGEWRARVGRRKEDAMRKSKMRAVRAWHVWGGARKMRAVLS